MRRLLSFALGLGIGLVIGGNLVRRLDAVQQRFAPDRIGVAASRWVEQARNRVVSVVGAATVQAPWRTGGEALEHPATRRDVDQPWTR